MKFLLLLLIPFIVLKPQGSTLVNHPFSGTLVLSAGGGASIGNTDIEDSKVGFSGIGMLEYFLPVYNNGAFGIRLQAGGYTIIGGTTATSPGYNTNIFSIGSGLSYLHSVEDIVFPYFFAGISYVNFSPATPEGESAPNREMNLYSANSFAYNAEIGTRFAIAANVSLNISMAFNFVQSDYLDDILYLDNNDKFTTINAGISFSFLGDSDSDGDGITNNKDACPDDPEDFDNFEDYDGCPDPDNDNDGITDIVDQCPDTAEDIDGFNDSDGCPDPDNDNDGVPDINDECSGRTEDYDGFQDDDGCPDFDNDNDRILDSNDKCPDQAEDLDGFEDLDGCPELDNDGDGILDTEDKCPNSAENFNGFEDTDGCPDIAPIRQEPELREETRRNQNTQTPQRTNQQPPQQRNQVTPPVKTTSPSGGKFLLEGFLNFEDDEAKLKPQAYNELDKIAEVMKKNPDQKWRIEGHTDKSDQSTYLSGIGADRAREVMLYLVKKGVPLNQLEIIDMKGRDPRADNDRPSAKALNRRVEIRAK